MKLEIIEGVDRLHEDLWSKIVNVSINSEGENSPKNILFGVQKRLYTGTIQMGI